MKRRFLLQAALAVPLVLIVALAAGRLLGTWRTARVDLGGRSPDHLSPAAITYLQGLDEPLSITYFGTLSERQPAHLKEVEGGVRSLLEAMARVAPRKIDWRVVDPDLSGNAGAAYAARHRVSPLKVRRVQRDETSEQSVWSSLVLALGDRPEVLIQGVGTADLPRLGDLVVGRLMALTNPRQPVFAVAAPEGYEGLRGQLANNGEVVDIDLEATPVLPDAVDVLFWVQPRQVGPAQQRLLRQFVAGGGTVVLAGSMYRIDRSADGAGYTVLRHGAGWSDLLRPLGLIPQADLLLDRSVGPLPNPRAASGQPEPPAFALRCLPICCNLKSFLEPARGGLSFVGASPLVLDPVRLEGAGFAAEVIATTTDGARVAMLPDGAITAADLQASLPVARQNLAVLLQPRDVWQGQVLVLASPAMLQDGLIDDPVYAHPLFLRNLVRTFTEPGRLVRRRLDRGAPPPVAVPGTAGRLLWRLAVTLAVPALLAGLAWTRLRPGGELDQAASAPTASRAPWARPGRRGLVAIGLATAALVTGPVADHLPALDVSSDQLNTPATATRELLAEHRARLRAEMVSSPRADLSPGLRAAQDRATRLLAGQGIAVAPVRVQPADPRARQSLLGQGFRPLVADRIAHDSLTVGSVWSGLRLSEGARSTVIGRLDEATAQHLDFLVCAALRRLERGQPPRIAVAAEEPRLSPAEALEDYQRQGLSAPAGTDIYSGATALLEDYGYQVLPVNPRAPVLEADPEAMVWLQPRRDASAMTGVLSRYLHRGGHALVAMQHFNIQQRQYRGGGFATVYWPQPQFQDLDPYLRRFGVEQVREILMDRTRSQLAMETQVNRGANREYEAQQVALPFLVRSVPAFYATGTALTEHLGDLLFVWGNRFAVDAKALAAAGLRQRVLITTSPQAWSYAWEGGWLPPSAFVPTHYLSGPQPLAMEVDGPFPEAPKTAAAAEPPAAADRGTGAEGSLLLVGCAEMFRNEYLHARGFAHDQFLLNAVAGLAWGPELATLQARHRGLPGFAFRTAGEKLVWRLVVALAGPSALALLGLARWGRQRRRWQRADGERPTGAGPR